jgi:hypothetical protein
MKWPFAALVFMSAAVFFASVAAWSAIPDQSGVIHGCYDIDTGALRVIDTDAGATCSGLERSLDWNQQGPVALVLGARVSEEGRLLLGSGVLNVAHAGTGEYRVRFDLDIASCFMSLISNAHPGEIAGEPNARDPAIVNVETFDSRGRRADGNFYLTVTCPTHR